MLKAASTLTRQAHAPGDWVRLVSAPEWGVGQVQSVAGVRVTVNFEHAGKKLVMTDIAVLESVPLAEHDRL
jgi:transcription elongation factor GreA-like protein